MTKKTKKIANRSGKKECPVCKKPNILVSHHINGRDIPNCNHPSNLTDICSNCHTKIHHGHIVVEGWFQTSMGKELLWHSVDEESFTGKDAKPYLI